MDFFDAVQARYSYRGPYKQDLVPREDLRRILEAGLAAPSGCNTQTTSLIGVDDPAVMKALTQALGKRQFASVPAAVLVLTQRVICYADVSFCVQDYSAAIENMLLAASALGYASCWVEGNVVNVPGVAKRMAEITGVPDGYELVAFLPVGVPEGEATRAQKKPFGQRAWFNGFGK